MTKERMVKTIREAAIELLKVRNSMSPKQISSGAARELDIALVKLADTLTALS